MVIPTSMPVVDEEMEKEVLRVLREEFFVGGKSVEKFEEEFAEYIGVDYAVAVSSGTDALVIALRCLGIKGKVIAPPMTFVATIESIVLAEQNQNLLTSMQIHGILTQKKLKKP